MTATSDHDGPGREPSRRFRWLLDAVAVAVMSSVTGGLLALFDLPLLLDVAVLLLGAVGITTFYGRRAGLLWSVAGLIVLALLIENPSVASAGTTSTLPRARAWWIA